MGLSGSRARGLPLTVVNQDLTPDRAHNQHVTTRWQNPARRDPGLFACLVALLVANLLTLASDLAHVHWLIWVVVAGYVGAAGIFVSRQVTSYRQTAKRFPIHATSPAQPHEQVDT